MTEPTDLRRLATILAAARRDRVGLTGIDAALVPADIAEAQTAQDLLLAEAGPIGAYKVLQIADRPGTFGQIPASRVLTSPATLPAGHKGLKIEAEIAFLIGHDLPGRADGAPYGEAEVRAAIAGAFAAFEIIESAFAEGVTPPQLVGVADAMSNWGLVQSPSLADWASRPLDRVAVRMEISGRAVVDQRGGHPSGHPFHPMVWLAETLARRGCGLRAGQMVTTGSFGGAHPVRPGDTVVATFDGFPEIRCRLD